ncbi:MAG: hypothetical protein WEE67_04270 [Chloroflexota bacterium]
MLDVVLLGLTGLSLVTAAFAIALMLGLLVRVKRLEESGMRAPTFGLEIGDPAPREAIEASLGTQAPALVEGPSLWFFASGGCEACQDLIGNMNAQRTELPTEGVLMVLPKPADIDALRSDAQFAAEWIVDSNDTLRTAFQALATPMGFVVRDGEIADRELGPNIERMLRVVRSQRAQ